MGRDELGGRAGSAAYEDLVQQALVEAAGQRVEPAPEPRGKRWKRDPDEKWTRIKIAITNLGRGVSDVVLAAKTGIKRGTVRRLTVAAAGRGDIIATVHLAEREHQKALRKEKRAPLPPANPRTRNRALDRDAATASELRTEGAKRPAPLRSKRERVADADADAFLRAAGYDPDNIPPE